MNGQAERCDRTAYVSGLQPTVSDIELFEVFNRTAHVEKVIVRNGTVRHALVVFKTVNGLYQVLVNFQGTTLHGRQLHIRPLRESSHANSETITTMFEKAKNQGGRPENQKSHQRPSSAQEMTTQTQDPPPQYSTSSSSYTSHRNHHNQNAHHQNPQHHSYHNPSSQQYSQNQRGYRNSSGSNGSSGLYGRRRNGGYNRSAGFQNESYSGNGVGVTMFDNHPVQQYTGFQQNQDIQFDDYAEGAKRFDNLANLIRASTPTDPFANYHKNSDASSCAISPTPQQRSRALSARDFKQPPPTWKMELRIKNEMAEAQAAADRASEAHQQFPQPLSMSPQEFLAQIAQQATIPAAEKQGTDYQGMRKKRPNLSVINPSLFYEQYPRTSSPVAFVPNTTSNSDKNPSPHDPAVLAYSRLRAPQSAFEGLSPIDTNNCSFITKHLGPTAEIPSNKSRDLTNEELSDMIVSTGNLRINPTITDSFVEPTHPEEPAPWSPLKRLRAESGSLSAAPIASPQFSPIKSKSVDELCDNDTEDDDVFGGSENKETSGDKERQQTVAPVVEQKISDFEDINNSRLPSNSHSAAPSSDQKSFVFPPEYPMCRHSSVPSIAHLVGDLSDFCPLSPHLTAGEKMLIGGGDDSVYPENTEDVDKTSEEKTSSDEKSSEDVEIMTTPEINTEALKVSNVAV
ncbi:hypothetical protein GCK72_001341 [Caenorhabditis remanei]|nr:hypothetical protein GCK72_001341 [Caenorhabditis remanei]KAF1769524.1 hypothetical protein GCK72_001341 [Caenorhabditis remanei]